MEWERGVKHPLQRIHSKQQTLMRGKMKEKKGGSDWATFWFPWEEKRWRLGDKILR